MKKLFSGITSLAIGLSMLVLPQKAALADSNSIDFETPTYIAGTINGQDGWKSLGAANAGCAIYDHAVGSSFSTTGFGSQSLRISNAVTSGCFGDQTFAKPLANAVGEVDSTDGPFSRGTLQNHFKMEFDIASKVPSAQQPGLFMNVSPDRGDGSRMSYLGFDDVATGINIIFFDVQGTTNPANFSLQDLGIYDRTVPHHIKLTLDTLNGPSNDVVRVWIDGVLKHTGTSWENYYRYDSESSAEQSPRIVKTVIFRTGGTAAPATAGNGYLVDNLSESSSIVNYTCTGFEAPMDKLVTVKKKANRVLPLKMVCTGTNGNVLGNGDIAAPIVQVTKTNPAGDATDPVDVYLSAGQGTDGNEFVFDGSRWYFNLQTKNFTGNGTYTITAVGGGSDVISAPTATFIVQ